MTTYTAPSSILTTVTTALRVSKGVNLPKQTPCDSVKWAVENNRELAGFTDMNALGLAQDGSVYIMKETTLSQDAPNEYPVAVDIIDGQVNVTIDHNLVQNFNMVYDEDEPSVAKKLTKVTEITFTE